MKYYLDAGTTWSKILKIDDDCNMEYEILLSKDLPKYKDITFKKVTGHNFSHVKKLEYVNEVVALSYGASNYIKPNGTILDLGSRDIKWAKYEDNKFCDMDWNSSCASSTGATISMLLKFYDVDVNTLIATKEKYPITCGVFGLEKIMDDISHGEKANIAISKFIHGIAYNAFNFTKSPEKLYISGGFCENKCFIDCLNFYTEVVPLGRFILVNGLLN